MENKAPLTFNIAGWYGIVIAVIFLIYGGVKIVLGFLDNNYEQLGMLILFTVIGLILITVAMGFRQAHKWGWYGLIGVTSLIILATLYDMIFQPSGSSLIVENLILLVCSGVALYSLFSPATKNYLKLAA